MTAAPADTTDVIALWPDGPPFRIDGVGAEIAYPAPPGPAGGTTFLRNITEPTLTVYEPASDAATGIGVVVAPGGGWTINAMSHEGVDVARWLVAAGHTVFLLKYRVQASDPDQAVFDARMAAMDGALWAARPTAGLPRAIGDLIDTDEYHRARDAAADDGRQAITIARERAAGLGVGTVGMVGFSAGAFLAVDVALDPRDAPLAFLGAIYGGETRGAPVPADAPPMFAAVAHDDLLRRIVEGVYADWTTADRPAELHVFRRGGHGFGMAHLDAPTDQWTDLFRSWLDDVAAGGVTADGHA